MSRDVVVVANRLPVRKDDDGSWATSPGGLVAALTPILQKGGTWIGWAGVPDGETESFRYNDIQHTAMSLTQPDIDDYYQGFCNGTLWPLFHDAVRAPEYHRTWWSAYQRVNRRYADAVLDQANPGDLVWVHDYHLLLVPKIVRDRSPGTEIRFFLHIPFPPIELYARLPWRRQLLEGMLGADVVAFQTQSSAENFIRAVRLFLEVEQEEDTLTFQGGATRVVTAPISVDFGTFESISLSPDTDRRVARIRNELADPENIILGADRLDYTKGVDVRLRAFETLLERHPEIADTTVLVQIVVPSRQTIGDYAVMREDIERMAGRINSVHGRRHRMPVHYTYESLDRELLVGYYRAADVMAVTPIVDGMNLVAKEYVASRVDEDGVLLLSEFAGAAKELTGAIPVNPYDIDGTAAAMLAAMEMEPGQRMSRMSAMRDHVRSHDLDAWTRQVLGPDLAAVTV